MAARGSKKSNDNFEKMKREMNAKKQKAKKQESYETSADQESISANIENIEPMMPPEINQEELPTDSDCPEALEEKLSDEKPSDEIKKIELVIFRIGEEEFAFRISNVKEIIRLPSMTKVPNAPFFVTGLCNIRGELLPVIDSRKLFGMAEVEYGEGSRIVVTDIQGEKVGLIADKVTEVLSIDVSMIKEPPASINGAGRGIINGIILLNSGKRVVMVLNAEEIVKAGKQGQSQEQQIQVNSIKNSDNTSEEEEQVIIFNIGAEEYAFDINYVKEIIRLPEITKVPNSAGYIEGLLSIRNQLLATINLGRLLDKDSQKPNEQSRVVIIDDGKTNFGVVVDRVSQVMRVQDNIFKKNRLSENSSRMEYIKGFLDLNNGKRIVMVLEPLKLVSSEDITKALSTDDSKLLHKAATDTKETEIAMEHVVIFKLGMEEYGININHVKEINRVGEMVNFPGAPAFIDGMVNLRGEVVPVLNLKTMFGSAAPENKYSKFLVVEFGGKRIGVLIDAASEVLRFPKDCLEEVSGMLDKRTGESFVDAVAKLNGGKRMVLILNLKELLSFT